MSDSNSIATPEHDLPSLEPWLRMLLSSAIPLLLGAFLPRAFLPLAGVAVAMAIAAVVMAVRQERRKRARPPGA